jgi:hypothetical protein
MTSNPDFPYIIKGGRQTLASDRGGEGGRGKGGRDSTFLDPTGYYFVEATVHEPGRGTPFFISFKSSYYSDGFLVPDVFAEGFIICIPILVF